MESADTDRSTVTFEDHVDAICNAVEAAGGRVVLAVHSGTGFSGYAASDRCPERIAAMVYVDSAPGVAPMDADFADKERPFNWEEIKEEENLDELTEEQLETFRQRALPQPGGVIRGSIALSNDARRDIPTTMICTAFSSDEYKKYAAQQKWSWLAGVSELNDITWIDLPTSHWPMWSRPRELAEIIGGVAERASS